MKRSPMMWLGIAVMLFAVSPAYSVTYYYVDPAGLDTNAGTTTTFPLKTITTAVSKAAAGDTIYVRGGTHTYTTTITISKTGTAGAMYYLLAYPGERPILDFSSMADADGNRGIRLSGNYWYIKGLDVKGAGDNGMNMSGSNCVIEQCAFYENRDSGLQLGGGAANNQIINCDSYNNCDSTQGNADGFSPKMDVGTGNYFYGCRSWQNSDDAYDGYLRGADDVTTTYENCWAMKAGYLKDGSIATNGNGNGFKMGGSDTKDIRHNVVLKNCLSFGNKVKGFDQNSDVGSMTLYNCTAFNNGGNNFYITKVLLTDKTATLVNCVSAGTGGISLGSFVVQTTDSWLSPFVVTNADFVNIDPAAAYGPRNADGSLPDITFMHLAAGSDLIDSGTDVGLPFSGTKPDLGCFEYVVVNDTTAPTPNPMTFATAPYASGAAAITMVATTASDTSGVEYYFASMAGGGHDSAWQSSTTYTDTGLSTGVTYTYRVIARDKSANHNETGWSVEASATLVADTTAPTPNPMTFSTLPYFASTTTVTMVATTASDTSGVEYYFACTAGGGHSSAWQDGTSYTDTGLSAGVTYTYRVIARDKSTNHNETGWSVEASAMIPADNTAPTPNPMTWQTVPYAISTTSAGMAASTATDASGGVQYYFTNLSVSGHDSGWQSAATYTDSGLTGGATYIYTVKARDISPAANQTAASAQMSVTMPSVPPLNAPSAYWPFDETSGSIAYDILGGNNGTLQGTPLPSWTVGQYGNCVSFINTTQSVRVPHSASIDFASESFSVSLWARQSASYSGQYELFIKGTIGGTTGTFPGSGKRYELYRKDTGFRFAIDDNSTKTELSVASSTVCTGNWVHIVAVRDVAADQLRLYANGSLISSGIDNTGGSISQTEPLYVGYAMSPGAVDDLRIYRYALTQAQITAIYGGAGLSDTTIPTPSPMSFATAPYGASSTSVAMTATTATDTSGVEYMFMCTSGGGHSSAWQAGTSYTDTGLAPSTSYAYTVKARDKSSAANETAASAPAQATTQADTTAPTPNPMTFATAPYAVSLTSIAMVATAAADISGVEYFVNNINDPNHNSGWQDSATYTDIALKPSTAYTYTVRARDKSASHSETSASDPASTTTMADTTIPTPGTMTWAVEPNAVGIDTITMTATTAADISGVEYFFANVTDPNHNSAWQDGTTYTDTGLANNTTYTYRVMARDKSLVKNETGWSAEASATTPRFVCTGTILSDRDGNCQVDFADFAKYADTWAGDTAAWIQAMQLATDWLVCNRNPAGECWQ